MRNDIIFKRSVQFRDENKNSWTVDFEVYKEESTRINRETLQKFKQSFSVSVCGAGGMGAGQCYDHIIPRTEGQKKLLDVYKRQGDDCPLTGMCYDFYLLEPIIKYYKTWCSYPDNFSLTDLIEQCYDSFFKCWHEEYEYWANDENAIREELHNNQYEDRLYYMDGRVYSGPLDDVA